MVGLTWGDMVKWCNARSEMDGLAPVYFTDNRKQKVLRTGNAGNLSHHRWTGRPRATACLRRRSGRCARAEAYKGIAFPGGNELGSGDAYFAKETGMTREVGHYAPNGYGLYDMAGNVWEACWDRYEKDHYKVTKAP